MVNIFGGIYLSIGIPITLECQINGGGGVRRFLEIDKQEGANNFWGVKTFPKTARI